jgi:membrane associated rhomboid family serine protease
MEENKEKKLFLNSLLFPTLFVSLLWMVKLIEIEQNWELYTYGVFPRTIDGLLGILTSPFIHSDFNHLIDNSIPLFILLTAIFYFYWEVAYPVFFLTYLMSGMGVWLFARPSYHIGASGLVYGFASFLFFSGIIRKNTRLMAISLLVSFVYGSMVWGILPYKEGISFEGHLAGGLAGLFLAYYFRKYGPQKPRPSWEEEEDEDENTSQSNNQQSTIINYIYIKSEQSKENNKNR